MSITSVRQQGGSVLVLGENGKRLFERSGTLVGYTGGSVTVRQGTLEVTFDDRGTRLYQR